MSRIPKDVSFFIIPIQIVFEGVVGPTYLSDIAVDDIYFTKGSCCQLKEDSFDAGLIGELFVTASISMRYFETFLRWPNINCALSVGEPKLMIC